MWFILGVIVTAVWIYVWQWAKTNNKSIKWPEWLLAVLSTVSLLFTMEVVVGSIAEGEPRAAVLSFILLGVTTAIFAVILWRRLVRTEKKVSQNKEVVAK